jgi:phosphoglycolate phosphatase-like HAD superfamily hydrolase
MAGLSGRTVIWDVDGTLAATTELGFKGTNSVLKANDYPEITKEEYLVGTRYTTPQRLAWHATGGVDGGDTTADVGVKLGAEFDIFYVALVSKETAGFYPGAPS